MCVPSAVAGAFATAAARSALFVVKSERVSTFGLKAMMAAGRSLLPLGEECTGRDRRTLNRSALHAVRRVDEQDARRSSSRREARRQDRLPAGRSRSRSTFEVLSGRVLSSATMYALSGKPDVVDSLSFGAAALCPSARVGRASAATAALAIVSRRPRFTPLRPGARRGSERARRTCSAGARCHACGTSRGRWGGGRSASSPPVIVRSGATASISNSKMSWSWMTSDSMRSTSVTATTRREPSSMRSMCTSRSSAAAMCCRMARSGRS